MRESDRVLVLECVQRMGVRAVPLSDFVARTSSGVRPYPGRIVQARHQDLPRARASRAWPIWRSSPSPGWATNSPKWETVKIGLRIALGRLNAAMPSLLVADDEYTCSEYIAKCYESIGLAIAWNGQGFITPADIAKDPRIAAVANRRRSRQGPRLMDIPAAFTALAEATWRRGGAARLEFFSLAGLLVVVLAELAFGKLGMEVLEGDTSAFDRAILLALRDPLDPARLIGPAWLQGVASDVTSLGGPAVLTFITLAIGGYLLVIRRWGTAALVGLSVASGSLLSAGLKLAFDRPRPDLVPHAVAVASASFPSGHVMLSAVTYLTVGALLMRAQGRVGAKVYVFAVAVLLTVAIGISRVYLGVHWPTDVLAGWCVGAAWALLCWLVATSLQRRRGDGAASR
jgi:undecaprenyl-diphosphatase